jgi:hypothetical protein
MAENYWLGVIVILLSGAVNGAFPLPMKYTRQWKWENTWLVFSVTALLVLPGILALGFIPDLGEVYRSVPSRALFYPIMLGFLWGIAQTTFGLGLRALGMALAFSIVAGLGALVGSLVPLLVVNPADLLRPRGLLLFASIPILFLGLYLYAQAGRARERDEFSRRAGDLHLHRRRRPKLEPRFRVGRGRDPEEPGAGRARRDRFVRGLAARAHGGLPRQSAVLRLSAPAGEELAGVRRGGLASGCGPGGGHGGALALRDCLLRPRRGADRQVRNLRGIRAVRLRPNPFLQHPGILAGEWREATPPTRRLLALGVAIIVLSVIVLSLGGLF